MIIALNVNHYFFFEICNLKYDILPWKSVLFYYILPRFLYAQWIFDQNLSFFSSFLQSNTAVEDRSLGKFLRWLINEQNGTFFGMKLPTGFQLIGQTTLQQYRAWLDYFDRQSKLENRSFVTRTTKRAYARIGVCFLFILSPL